MFSFSTLHQYEQCPFAFYLKKIVGDALNEGNYYSDIGSFVHEINEMIFKGDLQIDNAIDYFIDNYDNNVVYATKQSTMEKKYNEAIDYLAAFDIDRLKGYEILGIEKEVRFKLNRYNFIGYIDLLLRDKKTGKIIIVDHKSSGHFLGKNGKPLKNQLNNFNAYSKQMYLYSKAVYEEYGEFPEKICWNHFFEQTETVIPFVKEDYEDALNWAVDIIHKIYKDEEFQANQNYMMCNVLCSFKNCCEYKEESGG